MSETTLMSTGSKVLSFVTPLDQEVIEDFFTLSDRDRNLILFWANKVTEFDFKIVRKDSKNVCSPFVIYSGVVPIGEQKEWRKND